MQSMLSDVDYVCMRLNDGLKSLRIGDGNNDAADAIPPVFTSVDNIPHETCDSFTMEVEDNHGCVSVGVNQINDSEMDTVGHNKIAPRFKQKETKIPYHYFVRISPVALDASDIEPSFNTRDNFQLVAWKSPEGHIKANVSCDEEMDFVDPAKHGSYIIQCLNYYMERHGPGLFLYIRAPDDDDKLGQIGDHLIELCALFTEFQECFENMDIGWLPPLE